RGVPVLGRMGPAQPQLVPVDRRRPRPGPACTAGGAMRRRTVQRARATAARHPRNLPTLSQPMKNASTPARRRVLSIRFALLCAALAIATYSAFGGALPFAPHGYRVQIPTPSSQSLVVGSDVRTAGVKIGQVEHVDRRGIGASITIELQPAYV